MARQNEADIEKEKVDKEVEKDKLSDIILVKWSISSWRKKIKKNVQNYSEMINSTIVLDAGLRPRNKDLIDFKLEGIKRHLKNDNTIYTMFR